KYPAVEGDGLTVSIKENMFDKTDIDFKNRYKTTNISSASTTSHATTMATLVAGAGNSFYTGKGVANAALIASSDFANLLPDGNSYQQYNISIQNHSYGVGIENFYGSDAAAYDESMITNPTLLHVFSAGNMGTSADTTANSPYKNITGFANITGSFKMAKNILTVGSVDSFFTVPVLSSKGPAYDGRIKPELVAYGNDGSSGAAAITSGTVLAVQSAYAQQNNNILPVNALTKAIIINSADDINKTGPDFYSGYGNVNTYRAVADILSGDFFFGSVENGQTKDFTISIPVNAKNLKVTLVWTDPPAQTNAFTALVNDLDLQLQKESTAWFPWVLNSAPDKDSLKQAAKRNRDSLNVAEQVTLDNPASGDYTIHVNGYNIPSGTQDFYIAYRWETADKFYFISPAANDHFTSGGNSVFRWNSTYDATTAGKLEYSIDYGANWILVNPAIDLGKKYYKWITPDTFTTTLARMTIGSDLYISDTFNFSKQLSPHVGFNCDDSVLVFWNKAPGINQYRIYTLGEKYLQTIATTTDTSIVIANNSSPYLAVTTLLQDNHTGVNSYTFNYNNQGVACYISNFLADLTVNKTAQLQLSLGTFFNVRSIQFQQLTPNGWQTLHTITPVTNLENVYEANTMHAGINTFRAVVTLNNGSIITSNEAIIYYTGNNKFALMPNPVPRGQNLTILSDNFLKNTLIIYDITGRKVLQQSISGTRSDVAISRLAKGYYIVVIYAENTKNFTGKIIVE
ncbi:MAG: S8 family peptidase, partial [Panacibacter sp.]